MDCQRKAYECDKCGKSYKIKNAYERHTSRCVRTVSKATLQRMNAASELDELVNVAAEPSSPAIKRVRKKVKRRKSSQVYFIK